MNHQLELALFHAGEAKDIDSLKTLARQESNRAAMLAQLLHAVLRASGPVWVEHDFATSAGNNASFSLTEVDELDKKRIRVWATE